MSYLKDELKGFVPEEQAAEIIKLVTRGSSVMRLSKPEPMKSEVKKIPVMTGGAGAYRVGEGKRIEMVALNGSAWAKTGERKHVKEPNVSLDFSEFGTGPQNCLI